MTKAYTVLYTPGSFGNFISYLVDCHNAGKILPSPFEKFSLSHGRDQKASPTKNFDMAIPGLWNTVYNNKDKSYIAIVWNHEYFRYILHAAYSRAGSRNGKCGIEMCENNFYDYVHGHTQSHMLEQDILDLEKVFGFKVDKQNKVVPRHILRMYFWFKMVEDHENTVTIENIKLKNFKEADHIEIEQILDYKKCKSFFMDKFAVDLDFAEIHSKFIDENKSLREHRYSYEILDAVKEGKNITIQPLTTMGEAMILFLLDKEFMGIPFYNQIEFFKDTQQIQEYINYFPEVLKEPNNMFKKYWKKFPGE